ncbi:MAG: hypothetical protein ACJA04_000398 [Cellvibrionaceae bacterium]|jgi:hypothetical protein
MIKFFSLRRYFLGHIFISGSPYRTLVGLLGLLCLSTSCSTVNEIIPIPSSPYTFVDSTVYFAERTASLSMRSTFKKSQTATITEGYKFQFRTINTKPVFLGSISLIAGGKIFFLEEGQVILLSQNEVNFELSLETSQFLVSYTPALIQFRYNNESVIFTIDLHQVKTFSPRIL